MCSFRGGIEGDPHRWLQSRTLDEPCSSRRKLRTATLPAARFQLTAGGLPAYLPAVDEMISDRCHSAQLIKIYASPREGDQRYSPGEVVEAVPVVISGNPKESRICTSIVERQNLTMRMHMRRLTRLTNVFS